MRWRGVTVDRPIRVLHVGKYYPPVPGGMERVLQLLCQNERPGVDSRVLVANLERSTVREVLAGVPVTRLASLGRVGSVGMCPTLPLWLSRAEGDIVVVHEPNPMALVSMALAHPPACVLVWFHSEVVRPQWKYRLLYRPFLRAVLRRSARIIVSSPELARHAVELQPFRDKCVVVPFGVDTERLAATDEVRGRAAALRERYQTPIVLFVGRLVPYKGIDVLLRALNGIEATTLLVGDGPLRTALENQARKLGVSRVRFLGGVSDTELTALYHAADLFVLPSVTRAEAFGVVQLEAMACGVPVVSTNLPTGVPWVNQHDKTGLVVPPGDVAELRKALSTLLEDQPRREALGRHARERVEREFTLARMAQLTSRLYREVLHGLPSTGHRRPVTCPWNKRAFDVTLSGAGLLLSAPLWLLFALAIKLQDGGAVFYAQDRIGEGGTTFKALKFRSMVPGAEVGVGPIQAKEDDPRVTAVGRLMRVTAMDELPQLWNILRGDMSFVGPRALRPGETDTDRPGEIVPIEDVPGFVERCRIRPGLTGVAQIYADRDLPRRHKFRYDRLYIRVRSFPVDVKLILLSFWITFRGAWENRGRKF
jgi:rhamnosyl/mannosyltransferase